MRQISNVVPDVGGILHILVHLLTVLSKFSSMIDFIGFYFGTTVFKLLCNCSYNDVVSFLAFMSTTCSIFLYFLKHFTFHISWVQGMLRVKGIVLPLSSNKNIYSSISSLSRLLGFYHP